MLNEEFLTGLLSNEEVSVEDKIKQILGERDAETRGLLQKRDELLGSEKKLKERIAAFEKGNEEYNTKIKSLEEMLEKQSKGGETNKEYYETKLADLQKDYQSRLEQAVNDRDYYLGLHLNAMRDRAIEEGTKDLNFVPGLKQGFIARVLAQNDFEPEEIDGRLEFLNKDHHTIAEAINSFALTQEGKAYIANPSTGGGARGSGGGLSFGNQKQVSSQQIDTMSDEQLMKFALDGGQVV